MTLDQAKEKFEAGLLRVGDVFGYEAYTDASYEVVSVDDSDAVAFSRTSDGYETGYLRFRKVEEQDSAAQPPAA